MPELPEVETMRRGIAAIAGATIANVRRIPCRRKPIQVSPAPATFRRRAIGKKVAEVDRIGKRVVLRLDSTDCIVIEPRMTGLVLLADPPSREHLRLEICLHGKGPASIFYWDRRGLGSVRLLNSAEMEVALGPAVLGPDALAITVEQLRDHLGKSRREIKPALLDQRAVAGIGNLYASEILFLARINPRLACCDLSKKQWSEALRVTKLVLNKAIRYEGSTLGDGTYRNALNKEGGFQNHHRVYDKAGQQCRRCRQVDIVRIVQTQRATFYCPACQM